MTHLLGTRRKFGGEYFVAKASRHTKADANRYADNKRKQGWKARIVVAKHPTKGKEYYIYMRKT